ncbi:MAG TPA: IS701 family transposase [Geminicoccaceae bacterium]|nr:IS701 family transposase [Geminicoccaceae bacterium]
MMAAPEASGWRAELEELLARFGRLFVRAEPREQAGRYLEGLLGPIQRKNGWQLAEHLGDTRPWRTQRVLSHALWDEEAARDLCRDYAVERLGAAGAVLVVDETGFLKKGRHSAGVARQYSGTAGRIENSQIGVFLAYASRKGHALIDRRLYLPQAWAEDAERRRTAKIPEDVPFLTKPGIARAMLARALDAGVPCDWVLGDEVYGADRQLRLMLEARGQPYLLAIRSNDKLWSELEGQIGRHAPAALAQALPPRAWRRLSAGAGAKGERLFDWARLRLVRLQEAPPWEHWLLVRRSIAEPEDPAYFVVFGPATARLIDLARAAGRRWIVEECFEAAKQEVGLADYEVRSWHGWHRHVTLAMLALALLAALRAGLNAAKGGAGPPANSSCRSASLRSAA